LRSQVTVLKVPRRIGVQTKFIEPGVIDFDLVIMDEASQIRPVEALGAVARGKQLVVLGDDKQLPPTSFFDRVASDEGEAADEEDFGAGDVESILGLCLAQGLPYRMLRWHYRSRHESLIAISNLEFYRNLYVVPSAITDNLGLRFRLVAGTYDRGNTRTNRVEAVAVASAVIAHAREHSTESLGVGTFSIQQRDAVLDEIERLRRQSAETEQFFDPGRLEPFFVKNLESIQGDERDVIFISVGYGPDSDGYVAMNFGPVTQRGGERRLNVLISRARLRCEVFSSMTADRIDLARTDSDGARVLKTFLDYAATGIIQGARPGARDADSDFEIDVASALSRAGYKVDQQVGVAGFFIDLAIKNPERPGGYLLGIECDGATYHSSRSARDRDRIREQVLLDRGWRIHRIWSTDWFRQRDSEFRRAIAAVEAARAATPAAPVATRDPVIEVDKSEVLRATSAPSTQASVAGAAALTVRPAYEEATYRRGASVDPSSLRLGDLMELVCAIVKSEGPIHEEEIGRRVATACGKDRAGSRIQNATRRALAYAVKSGRLFADGRFHSSEKVEELSPRDRSGTQSSTLRQPEMLPPIEIRTGLKEIVSGHIGVSPDDAITEVARMFGFQRTGQELQRVVEEQLRSMLAAGQLLLRNDCLYAPSSENG
jgi:very-short-patch-repair endonuclease